MNQRYYSFSQFLKDKFGFKVYKIPIDAGFTCPTRDGTLGYSGCTYCNAQSFSLPTFLAYRQTGRTKTSVYDQIQYGKKLLERKSTKFLAYFQPYTNTYADVKFLKKVYDEALLDPDIVGLCIGTRPDCVPDEVLDLIESYAKKCQVWLEYGLQSIHNKTLLRINRGHNFAQFKDAIKRTRNRNIFICVHIILGLPDETKKDMLETVKTLAKMDIDGIKIHHLQVIKSTNLAKDFEKKEFKTLSIEEYIPLVSDIIELLPPNITIQRLVGEVLEDDMLIAPKWNLTKSEIVSRIEQELTRRNFFQGLKFKNLKNNVLKPKF
ncbi:TIGR01212 family radical SAM protein [candidate division WOR-3 bacterium]|nr:TIGR01212 family radical SAM protein [candidate division WOR-3 bacterium]